jgi:hypothetical protein
MQVTAILAVCSEATVTVCCWEAPTVANLADHVRRERGDVRQPSDRAAPEVTITVMHDPSRRP